MAFWVSVKGHNMKHPFKRDLEESWEHENRSVRSFGWISNKNDQIVGITELQISPNAVLPKRTTVVLPQYCCTTVVLPQPYCCTTCAMASKYA